MGNSPGSDNSKWKTPPSVCISHTGYRDGAPPTSDPKDNKPTKKTGAANTITKASSPQYGLPSYHVALQTSSAMTEIWNTYDGILRYTLAAPLVSPIDSLSSINGSVLALPNNHVLSHRGHIATIWSLHDDDTARVVSMIRLWPQGFHRHKYELGAFILCDHGRRIVTHVRDTIVWWWTHLLIPSLAVGSTAAVASSSSSSSPSLPSVTTIDWSVILPSLADLRNGITTPSYTGVIIGREGHGIWPPPSGVTATNMAAPGMRIEPALVDTGVVMVVQDGSSSSKLYQWTHHDDYGLTLVHDNTAADSQPRLYIPPPPPLSSSSSATSVVSWVQVSPKIEVTLYHDGKSFGETLALHPSAADTSEVSIFDVQMISTPADDSTHVILTVSHKSSILQVYRLIPPGYAAVSSSSWRIIGWWQLPIASWVDVIIEASPIPLTNVDGRSSSGVFSMSYIFQSTLNGTWDRYILTTPSPTGGACGVDGVTMVPLPTGSAVDVMGELPQRARSTFHWPHHIMHRDTHRRYPYSHQYMICTYDAHDTNHGGLITWQWYDHDDHTHSHHSGSSSDGKAAVIASKPSPSRMATMMIQHRWSGMSSSQQKAPKVKYAEWMGVNSRPYLLPHLHHDYNQCLAHLPLLWQPSSTASSASVSAAVSFVLPLPIHKLIMGYLTPL